MATFAGPIHTGAVQGAGIGDTPGSFSLEQWRDHNHLGFGTYPAGWDDDYKRRMENAPNNSWHPNYNHAMNDGSGRVIVPQPDVPHPDGGYYAKGQKWYGPNGEIISIEDFPGFPLPVNQTRFGPSGGAGPIHTGAISGAGIGDTPGSFSLEQWRRHNNKGTGDYPNFAHWDDDYKRRMENAPNNSWHPNYNHAMNDGSGRVIVPQPDVPHPDGGYYAKGQKWYGPNGEIISIEDFPGFPLPVNQTRFGPGAKFQPADTGGDNGNGTSGTDPIEPPPDWTFPDPDWTSPDPEEPDSGPPLQLPDPASPGPAPDPWAFLDPEVPPTPPSIVESMKPMIDNMQPTVDDPYPSHTVKPGSQEYDALKEELRLRELWNQQYTEPRGTDENFGGMHSFDWWNQNVNPNTVEQYGPYSVGGYYPSPGPQYPYPQGGDSASGVPDYYTGQPAFRNTGEAHSRVSHKNLGDLRRELQQLETLGKVEHDAKNESMRARLTQEMEQQIATGPRSGGPLTDRLGNEIDREGWDQMVRDRYQRGIAQLTQPYEQVLAKRQARIKGLEDQYYKENPTLKSPPSGTERPTWSPSPRPQYPYPQGGDSWYRLYQDMQSRMDKRAEYDRWYAAEHGEQNPYYAWMSDQLPAGWNPTPVPGTGPTGPFLPGAGHTGPSPEAVEAAGGSYVSQEPVRQHLSLAPTHQQHMETIEGYYPSPRIGEYNYTKDQYPNEYAQWQASLDPNEMRARSGYNQEDADAHFFNQWMTLHRFPQVPKPDMGHHPLPGKKYLQHTSVDPPPADGTGRVPQPTTSEQEPPYKPTLPPEIGRFGGGSSYWQRLAPPPPTYEMMQSRLDLWNQYDQWHKQFGPEHGFAQWREDRGSPPLQYTAVDPAPQALQYTAVDPLPSGPRPSLSRPSYSRAPNAKTAAYRSSVEEVLPPTRTQPKTRISWVPTKKEQASKTKKHRAWNPRTKKYE